MRSVWVCVCVCVCAVCVCVCVCVKGGRITHSSERVRERVAPVGARRQVDEGADEEAEEAESAAGDEEGPHHAAR